MKSKHAFLLLLGLGLAPGLARAADWHVRLTVTAPDDPPPVRVDSGNVFGRLHDSVDGLDSHDLPEMPPASGSMGDRYLSIVFPHPEWGGEYDSYASDFRAPTADEIQGASWPFEVRTRTPGIRTVVSWQEGTGNPFAVLPRSRIKDAATGQVLVADASQTASFTISSTQEVNSYVWEYGQQNPCGCGRVLPKDTWLMTAPSCQPADPPGTGINAQYGNDISGGMYGTNWIGWKWDAANQNYPGAMAGTDPLALGIGNWVYSTAAATLALDGTAAPIEPYSNYGSSLPGNCFAIDLAIPPEGAKRWNMVGHPFPYTVNWADVRIAVSPAPNGSALWITYSPSAAIAANYVSKTFHRWTGSSYEPKDDATPGSVGILQPQEAVWVRSLGSYSVGPPQKLKLLIPAQ